MPLVTITDLTIGFRGPALLDSVNCQIESGQKIGLLGRNGAGKSTLMRMLLGEVEPDHGSITLETGAKVAFLPQEVPHDLIGTVREVVRMGVRSNDVSEDDRHSDWEVDHKVDQILSRMELDAEASVDRMSSGMKRRVLLARTLVDRPDLLLLDEPTNHLDIAAINWLENFLARWNQTLMFVTHDRRFLRNLATRILEIEGGRLFDWSCDYETFLRRKEDALAAEEKQNALFDKKLAAEEVWIRQGIKARRTRNEGRVRALEQLRREYSQRRSKVGTTNLQIQEGARSGTIVARLEDVSYEHRSAEGNLAILENFSTTILRGDRVGLIGRNGSGKTTLLKILLGQLQPQSGSVRLGSNLQIAYFDQLRGQLDPEKTVEYEVADGYQTIVMEGQSRHVLGYLQDFLFTPERARTPIGRLSGGERNRVLLAKLFAKPANVIVLDEPTNDLDAETLEMLEERLCAYSGTLLVVSHDREFLNNVVTSTIAITVNDDESRRVDEYVGGYDDWLRQSQQALNSSPDRLTTKNVIAKTAPDSPVLETSKSQQSVKRLSFKEQQELQRLPQKISEVEATIAKIHAEMLAPEYFKQTRENIAASQAKLAKHEEQLASFYARWEELDG